MAAFVNCSQTFNAGHPAEIKATPVRIATAEAEVARLVDGVAQMGMSDALKRRLKIAEDELQGLEETAEDISFLHRSRPKQDRDSGTRSHDAD